MPGQMARTRTPGRGACRLCVARGAQSVADDTCTLRGAEIKGLAARVPVLIGERPPCGTRFVWACSSREEKVLFPGDTHGRLPSQG